MATYNNVGETIEGLAFEGATRRWELKGLVKNKIYDCVMKLYSCDFNSHVEITKTIDVPEDASLKERTSFFHRSEGDRLTADAIEVWLERKGKVSSEIKEGVSGRHGATLFSTKGHSIAVIRTPLSNLIKMLAQQQVAENKPVIEKQ